jgi:hypothetical protein
VEVPRVFKAIAIALSASTMVSLAYAQENIYRFNFGQNIGLTINSDIYGESSEVDGLEAIDVNWLSFYHANNKYLSLTSESELNGLSIDLPSLNISSENLPNMSYPYGNVGSINLSNNNFSDLNFLYGINNLTGSIDVSGNTGLRDLSYISGLNISTASQTVTFDPVSQYGSLMDEDSPLCVKILNSTVSVKTLVSGEAISSLASDYCVVKQQWIQRFKDAGQFTSFNKDSQLNQQILSFSGAGWDDGSLPSYNFPSLSNVKGFSISSTSLTNVDFLLPIKSVEFTNHSFSIQNNPNLINLDGLSNVAGRSKYSSSQGFYANNVYIRNNASLVSIEGLNVGKISGSNSSSTITISNNPVLEKIGSLSQFSGYSLSLTGNPNLTDISFLSSLNYYGWNTSRTTGVTLDLNNIEVKVDAEDGTFCQRIVDRIISVNRSNSNTMAMQVCDIDAWPQFFIDNMGGRIYVESNGSLNSLVTTYRSVISNNSLAKGVLDFSGKNFSGIWPKEAYPNVRMGEIKIVNTSGIEDMSFLRNNTHPMWMRSVHHSPRITLDNLSDLMTLDGIENFSTAASGAVTLSLTIKNNPLLNDISALSGRSDIRSVYLENNPSLVSLNGMEGLISAWFYLKNANVEDITPLTDLVKNNTHVDGFHMTLINTKITEIPSSFSGAKSRYFTITGNRYLTNIDGLRGMNIKSRLTMIGNSSLKDISPLGDLDPASLGYITISHPSTYTTLLSKDSVLCKSWFDDSKKIGITNERLTGGTSTSTYSELCK